MTGQKMSGSGERLRAKAVYPLVPDGRTREGHHGDEDHIDEIENETDRKRCNFGC